MKGDKLPPSHHIARLCMPKSAPDGEIQASAFMLKAHVNEEYLSVNWLEFLGYSDREAEIIAIREVYSKKLRVPAKAKIATFNIGETCSYVHKESPDNRMLEILHEPIDEPGVEDPSHSGIFGMKQDNLMIAELICDMIQADYPARIKMK